MPTPIVLAYENDAAATRLDELERFWTAPQIVPWTQVLDRRQAYAAIMLGPHRP